MTDSTSEKPVVVAGVSGTKQYRWIGNHPQEFNMDDKVNMVGPGEFVDLDNDTFEANKELFDLGLLLEVEGKK